MGRICEGLAIDCGADSIVLSNHGGRPLVHSAALGQAGIERLLHLCAEEMRVLLTLAAITGVDGIDRSMHV